MNTAPPLSCPPLGKASVMRHPESPRCCARISAIAAASYHVPALCLQATCPFPCVRRSMALPPVSLDATPFALAFSSIWSLCATMYCSPRALRGVCAVHRSSTCFVVAALNPMVWYAAAAVASVAIRCTSSALEASVTRATISHARRCRRYAAWTHTSTRYTIRTCVCRCWRSAVPMPSSNVTYPASFPRPSPVLLCADLGPFSRARFAPVSVLGAAVGRAASSAVCDVCAGSDDGLLGSRSLLLGALGSSRSAQYAGPYAHRISRCTICSHPPSGCGCAHGAARPAALRAFRSDLSLPSGSITAVLYNLPPLPFVRPLESLARCRNGGPASAASIIWTFLPPSTSISHRYSGFPLPPYCRTTRSRPFGSSAWNSPMTFPLYLPIGSSRSKSFHAYKPRPPPCTPDRRSAADSATITHGVCVVWPCDASFRHTSVTSRVICRSALRPRGGSGHWAIARAACRSHFHVSPSPLSRALRVRGTPHASFGVRAVLMVVAVVCARLSPPPPGLGVVVWLGVLSVAGVLLRVYGFGVLS